MKILDCTLRDGGYINNWNFGYESIKLIIKNLVDARLDYVECGFFKPDNYIQDKSIFTKIEQLSKILPNQSNNTLFTLMINFGEYDINKIPDAESSKILFRVAFKKKMRESAIDYCKQLKTKGYEIFINPMHTGTYSEEELLELIDEVNKIKPIGFTIVDTTGGMKKNDVLSLFYLINSNLNRDIALCFHSHDNLQLSFSNAQCLIKACKDRELIIDSSLFGMGRGAGKLRTEIITHYVNDNCNSNYKMISILNLVDEQIKPIFEQNSWGYSVPYYLTAINNCHPNYAKYLIDKNVPFEKFEFILHKIPDNKKYEYDKDVIEHIYLE